MFCRNCGNQLNEDNSFCEYCGYKYDISKFVVKKQQSRKGLGFVLGLFFSLIGLIIGICAFKDYYEKSTFVKGWLMSLCVEILLGVLFYYYFNISMGISF